MDDPATGSTPPTSAAPSLAVRLLGVAAIIIAGVCGGLIGYAVTDLQCDGDCTILAGLIGLAGAIGAAGGVAVVVVLTMRAMAEWQPPGGDS